MLDLSIVIISYNTKDFLVKCLDSITTNTSKKLKYEIIVVDNGSSDGTARAIQNVKSQMPASPAQRGESNVKVIENGENLGFSKANNIGVKAAKGRYILFLNSDTQVFKNTLEEMVIFMDYHKDAGAATCYVELPDKKPDDASHRGFPTPWNAFCHFSGLGKIFPGSTFFNGYHLGWENLTNVHEIDALAGAFMIVRREAGEQVKWWSEDYFFYGEDLDFCYMLRKTGRHIYFVPTVKVLHYKGVSSGIKKESQHLSTADKAAKQNITNARFDAMKIFYSKHYNKIYPPLITRMVLGGVELKRNLTLRKYR